MTQEPLRRLGLYISQSQGRGYWYIVTNHDDGSSTLTWLGDPPHMTESEVHQLLRLTPPAPIPPPVPTPPPPPTQQLSLL